MSSQEEQDLKRLRAALVQFPGGASLDEIRVSAGLPVSHRTLIRRLNELVARGVAQKSGLSRAARYTLADAGAAAIATPVELEPAEPGPAEPKSAEPKSAEPKSAQRGASMPLGKRGAEILRLVKQPPAVRPLVGYNRKFLSSYRPNHTSYLSASERARLIDISRTVDAGNERAGTYAQRILNRLLIDLSWNSSRLEGNTYSLLDTQRLIEAGEPAEGKAGNDTQMILNHKAAIEFLVQSAEEIAFNRYTILNLHSLLAENLLPSPGAEGRIRRIPVNIGRSVYQPLDVPQLLEECFDEMLAKADAIEDPFEQAFFIMVQLPYLQPFEDVNKRVSRLAANIPLFRRNLAPISFVDVPDDAYTWGTLGVYELNRIDLLKDVFLWAYERSAARYAAIRQTTGEPDPFRLRHRQALKQVISHVIREPMNQREAARYIPAWSADHVPEADRARFIEVAETELMSIHDGNFARYQVRPSEYQAWQEVWRKR